MGRLIEKSITRFDGGIMDNRREPTYNKGGLIEHFDIFSDPYRLRPHRDTSADENDGSTATGMKQYDVRHFQLGLDGKLYGLGKTAANLAKVVSKADPTTGNWTLEATAESAAARVLGCFFEWRGAFYMFTSTNKLSKWTIGGTFTDTVLTLSEAITTVAQGIVAPDGNAYVFYNNKVVRIDSDGTATDEVCSAIPDDMRIVSVCRWGNYLALGCAYGTSNTATPSGRSQVYIWDMVTNSTVSDVIDWGEGALTVLGNIESRICGVSNKYLEESTASDDLGINNGSMVVKLWSGGITKVLSEIIGNQSVNLGRMIRDVVIKENRMYWVASVPYNTSTSTESTYHLGIWSFGRKGANYNFALSLDYIEDSVDTSNFKINSFGSAGNYWYINHSADGSIEKTSNTETYTTTSVFETGISGDGSTEKKLVGVCVTTEKQPTGGQTVIKYKKDGETTWTTISTNSTANELKHKAVKIQTTGKNLPHFREIEFRVESTGGTAVTGISHKYEIIDKDVYA